MSQPTDHATRQRLQQAINLRLALLGRWRVA
jgi:hypothetical protein